MVELLVIAFTIFAAIVILLLLILMEIRDVWKQARHIRMDISNIRFLVNGALGGGTQPPLVDDEEVTEEKPSVVRGGNIFAPEWWGREAQEEAEFMARINPKPQTSEPE